MKLIDTHCHLAHGRLKQNLPDVLQRATDAGVDTVICAAADLEDSIAAIAICEDEKFPNSNIFCTAGIHPHDATNADTACIARIGELAGNACNVAIGEIGLDYHYDFSPRDRQKQAFADQLQLAIELQKPVVVHSREAFDDTMSILNQSGVDMTKVLFHSFTGGPDQAEVILATGALMSFSGIATFKTADDLRQSVLMTPDDRITLETDGPFLSPEPVRKMKTNEPANVVHIANILAQLRGVSPEQFATQTTANAERFFAIPQR